MENENDGTTTYDAGKTTDSGEGEMLGWLYKDGEKEHNDCPGDEYIALNVSVMDEDTYNVLSNAFEKALKERGLEFDTVWWSIRCYNQTS